MGRGIIIYHYQYFGNWIVYITRETYMFHVSSVWYFGPLLHASVYQHKFVRSLGGVSRNGPRYTDTSTQHSKRCVKKWGGGGGWFGTRQVSYVLECWPWVLKWRPRGYLRPVAYTKWPVEDSGIPKVVYCNYRTGAIIKAMKRKSIYPFMHSYFNYEKLYI